MVILCLWAVKKRNNKIWDPLQIFYKFIFYQNGTPVCFHLHLNEKTGLIHLLRVFDDGRTTLHQNLYCIKTLEAYT